MRIDLGTKEVSGSDMMALTFADEVFLRLNRRTTTKAMPIARRRATPPAAQRAADRVDKPLEAAVVMPLVDDVEGDDAGDSISLGQEVQRGVGVSR